MRGRNLILIPQALSVLRELAASRGDSEPRTWLALAVWLAERFDPDDGWEAAVRASSSACRLLERCEGLASGTERRSATEYFDWIVTSASLAAKLGLRADLPEIERLERRSRLRRAVAPTLQRFHAVARGTLHGRWEALESWLDRGERHDLSALAALQSVMESQLRALLSDRWAEVQRDLRRTALAVQEGRCSADDAERQAAERCLTLIDTLEVSRWKDVRRASLRAQSQLDVDRFAELRPVALALALFELLKEDPAMPRAALGLLGTAIEGALGTRLFQPYLAALKRGEASPISAGPAFDRHAEAAAPLHLTIGDLVIPWGKLVTSRIEAPSPAIQGLVDWVACNFRAPQLLANPKLNVMERVRVLRNQAAHHQSAEPAIQEAAELIALAVHGEAAVLPTLYAALGGATETASEP